MEVADALPEKGLLLVRCLQAFGHAIVWAGRGLAVLIRATAW